jgi:hypothetical protein
MRRAKGPGRAKLRPRLRRAKRAVSRTCSQPAQEPLL